MRWPSFLTRRPALAEPHHINLSTRRGPLTLAHVEIDRAIARRRKARLARPAPSEAQRFERARPKLNQLAREIATMPVPF